MEYVTIEIPVHLWWQVDGCVDNSMAIDAVEAVIATAMAGSCVRNAGWRASAAFDGERDQYGWPPQNHPLAVVLRTAHWEWTLAQLDCWEPYATDSSSAEVRALIVRALRDR